MSSKLGFMNLAIQREDDLSHSQFHIPQEGLSWVSGLSLVRSPVTTWAGYGAEGHLQKVTFISRLENPRIG